MCSGYFYYKKLVNATTSMPESEEKQSHLYFTKVVGKLVLGFTCLVITGELVALFCKYYSMIHKVSFSLNAFVINSFDPKPFLIIMFFVALVMLILAIVSDKCLGVYKESKAHKFVSYLVYGLGILCAILMLGCIICLAVEFYGYIFKVVCKLCSSIDLANVRANALKFLLFVSVLLICRKKTRLLQ